MFLKLVFRYSLLIFFLLIVTGCAGLGDFSIDLPGNYSVIRTSAHQVKIYSDISEPGGGSHVIIPTKITEVAWDDNYILAKQLGLMHDPESSNGSKIPNNDSVHFWILEIESGEVFGPAKENAFIKWKAELGISETVRLEKIEDLGELMNF